MCTVEGALTTLILTVAHSTITRTTIISITIITTTFILMLVTLVFRIKKLRVCVEGARRARSCHEIFRFRVP